MEGPGRGVRGGRGRRTQARAEWRDGGSVRAGARLHPGGIARPWQKTAHLIITYKVTDAEQRCFSA